MTSDCLGLQKPSVRLAERIDRKKADGPHLWYHDDDDCHLREDERELVVIVEKDQFGMLVHLLALRH